MTDGKGKVDVDKPRDALGVLMELTQRLSSDEAMDESLQAITDAAMDLFPAAHASIRLFDETGSQLLSGARSGEGSAHRPVTFRPGEGIVGWVAEHGQVVRIGDARTDERYAEKSGQGFAIRSILAVPLWSAGRVVGVLAVTSPEASAFSEQHETLLQLLANGAVPPIDRARMEVLAATDRQTRAYNQRYLFPRLRQEIERSARDGTPLSVALLDLDNLRTVNQQHGHAVGDEVLSSFANCVRAAARLHDVLIRRGGEEFVLILPHTNLAQAEKLGERIRRRLERDGLKGGMGLTVTVTVTIGVAAWDGEETAEELELRADWAMYEGKRLGKNRVVLAEPVQNASPDGSGSPAP